MRRVLFDQALARAIRLVGLDVDGVLTDGGLFLGTGGDQPIEFKRFHIQDGLGIKLLQAAGILVVLVSGRVSPATTARARDLGVDEVVQGPADQKLPAFAQLLERRGVGFNECAFVGDDLPDLALLARVGLAIAVANAVPEVKAAARVVTRAAGGQGAVREVAELLLKAQGTWDSTVRTYMGQGRGNAPKGTPTPG
jgi:3-deoxy-D-manno-octulosonate 8-phosphate phosphatase (KDO 8-P phosphatase)